jgi:hypothetical protein
MGLYKPKRIMETDETRFGVCLWRFDDGSYLMDDQLNHFSAQGVPYDPLVEQKMRRAVLQMGIENGAPFWLPGLRKITEGEWEDQMASLLDGEIPDAVDVYRQNRNGN